MKTDAQTMLGSFRHRQYCSLMSCILCINLRYSKIIYFIFCSSGQLKLLFIISNHTFIYEILLQHIAYILAKTQHNISNYRLSNLVNLICINEELYVLSSYPYLIHIIVYSTIWYKQNPKFTYDLEVVPQLKTTSS